MVIVQFLSDIIVGTIVGAVSWACTRNEEANRRALIGWALATAIGSLLLGVLLAALVGRSFAEEYMARKSFLSLAVALFSGAGSLFLIHNIYSSFSDRDDA